MAASPEEILATSMAPMAKTISDYGTFQVALAAQQAARQQALADEARRNAEAERILGLRHQNALAVQKQQDDAALARTKAKAEATRELLGERLLAADVEDVEEQNRGRAQVYHAAAARGFRLDPDATPEQNELRARKVLEDEAVATYGRLVSERQRLKQELDELLQPKSVSTTSLAQRLASDPNVARVLKSNQLELLRSGKASIETIAGNLGAKERSVLLGQAEALREKLQAALDVERQQKARIAYGRLQGRHDELTQAIAAAQKAIPPHRLGEVFTTAPTQPRSTASQAGDQRRAALLRDIRAAVGGETSSIPKAGSEKGFRGRGASGTWDEPDASAIISGQTAAPSRLRLGHAALPPELMPTFVGPPTSAQKLSAELIQETLRTPPGNLTRLGAALGGDPRPLRAQVNQALAGYLGVAPEVVIAPNGMPLGIQGRAPIMTPPERVFDAVIGGPSMTLAPTAHRREEILGALAQMPPEELNAIATQILMGNTPAYRVGPPAPPMVRPPELLGPELPAAPMAVPVMPPRAPVRFHYKPPPPESVMGLPRYEQGVPIQKQILDRQIDPNAILGLPR